MSSYSWELMSEGNIDEDFDGEDEKEKKPAEKSLCQV